MNAGSAMQGCCLDTCKIMVIRTIRQRYVIWLDVVSTNASMLLAMTEIVYTKLQLAARTTHCLLGLPVSLLGLLVEIHRACQ